MASTPLPSGEVTLEAAPDGTPGPVSLHPHAEQVLAEVPTSADSLPVHLRLAWRLALREALSGHLSAGYAVTGLARQGEQAWYVLEQAAQPG